MNKLNATLVLLVALSVSPTWASTGPATGEKPCAIAAALAKYKNALKDSTKACTLLKTCPVDVASATYTGKGRVAQ